jgi:hypothetical protein
MWNWQSGTCGCGRAYLRSRRALPFSEPRRLPCGVSITTAVLVICTVVVMVGHVSSPLDGYNLPWRPQLRVPSRERGRRLIQSTDYSGLQLVSYGPEELEQGQQQQQPGSSMGGGGISSAGLSPLAALDLAHNLKSASRERIAQFYQQKLNALLDGTPGLLQWVEPRARHRFCFPCAKGPAPQVSRVGSF